jgi:hypothetical protein
LLKQRVRPPRIAVASVIALVTNDPIYLWQPPLLLVDGDAHLGKRGIDLRVGP